jgi:hypothetical protein
MEAESEKEVERHFVKGIKRLGGWPLRLALDGNRGWPDYTVIWPFDNIGIVFVELKTKRGRLSKQQVNVIDKLNTLGCRTFVLKGLADVDAFFVIVENTLEAPNAEV